MEEIFNKDSFENPLVQELSSLLEDNSVKLPYIEKDKILMSPGVWNGKYYSAEEIKKAFEKTDWSDKQNKFLFYDHDDKKASEWVGEISEPRVDDEGFLKADTIYYDPILAIKLAYGKPKIGISPKVFGNDTGYEMKDFVYKNFSIVVVPAVKTAWINNSEGNKPLYLESNSEQHEVRTMEANETKAPIVEPKQELAETKTETMSEELASFVEFYNQEKLKNPALTLTEVCNAFISKDKKPMDEPKEKEEEKPGVPSEEMSEKKAEPKVDLMSDKSREVDELKMSVKTLSEQIIKLNEKLEAPERVTSKAEVVKELAQQVDSDEAFMNYMKRM